MKKLLVLAVLLLFAVEAFAQEPALISNRKWFKKTLDSIYVAATYRWVNMEWIHVAGSDTLHIYANSDTAGTQCYYLIPSKTLSIPAQRLMFVRARAATDSVLAIYHIK